MRRFWVLQHDNNPQHKSKATCHLSNQNKVRALEWPSQSPYRNIIEPLWGDLKCAVHASQPKNLQEPASFGHEEWTALRL